MTRSVSALSGFYLKVLPQNDQWGTAFYVAGGTAADGIYQRCDQIAEWMISSSPRMAVRECKKTITFLPMDPATAYFDITGMISFNKDLVNWSGSWISVPKSAQLGTT